MTNTMRKKIGQVLAAHALRGGVANVEVREEVRQTGNGQVKIINVIPVMTDTERETAKKRIGNDLHEIFTRIRAELGLDSESIEK